MVGEVGVSGRKFLDGVILSVVGIHISARPLGVFHRDNVKVEVLRHPAGGTDGAGVVTHVEFSDDVVFVVPLVFYNVILRVSRVCSLCYRRYCASFRGGFGSVADEVAEGVVCGFVFDRVFLFLFIGDVATREVAVTANHDINRVVSVRFGGFVCSARAIFSESDAGVDVGVARVV